MAMEDVHHVYSLEGASQAALSWYVYRRLQGESAAHLPL